MHLRTLLILGLGIASLPAFADDTQTTNPNVKRAMRSAKKVRPSVYKPPRHDKKPKKRVTYGAH